SCGLLHPRQGCPVMKLRNPFLIRLLGFFGSWIAWLWMTTVHYRLVFYDGRYHPVNPRGQRYLYAFWHESILFLTRFRVRVNVLSSQRADGELIARVCRHRRVKVGGGSPRHGGSEALLEMHRRCRYGHLLVTPDGPLGPRRRLRTGTIFLASRTGLAIMPCG